MLEAEQDSINKRTCIVHHIALIQNSATYNTEAIIIEKTPRVTSSVDTLHIQAFERLRNELEILDENEKEIIPVGGTNCDLKCNQNSNA